MPPESNPHVLIVDDDPALLEALTAAAARKGPPERFIQTGQQFVQNVQGLPLASKGALVFT